MRRHRDQAVLRIIGIVGLFVVGIRHFRQIADVVIGVGNRLTVAVGGRQHTIELIVGVRGMLNDLLPADHLGLVDRKQIAVGVVVVGDDSTSPSIDGGVAKYKLPQRAGRDSRMSRPSPGRWDRSA